MIVVGFGFLRYTNRLKSAVFWLHFSLWWLRVILGVLLIIKPSSDGFNYYSILAIIGVLFIILRDLTTHRINQSRLGEILGFAHNAGRGAQYSGACSEQAVDGDSCRHGAEGVLNALP